MKKYVLAAAACLGLMAATPGQAAFINVDDSDPSTITIFAGDFEFGFSVNGNLLTTGIGIANFGTITLPDGGHTISGSWIDNGGAHGARVDIFFALPSNPTFVTSGIEFGASSNGTVATLSGSLGGYLDPSQYFFTGLPTAVQDGHTEFGGVAFLSVQFKSEAVPEPTSLALLGAGLLGIAAARRRQSRR